jgi:hypothetical protein
MRIWLALFFQISTIIHLQAQPKNEVVLSGRIISSNTNTEDVVVRNENSNTTTKTNQNGSFRIACKMGDVLNFSATHLETKRKKITLKEYESQTVFVEMTSKIIALDEVIISTNQAITAEKLHIIPENQKKYTPAERRLKTAGDFKPIHLLAILGGGMPLDPVINKISGRTKKLKKELEIEKKEKILERLKILYPNDYIQKKLSIPSKYIDAFRYFCIEDSTFVSHFTAGNQKLTALALLELAITFNKNILSEE